MLMQQSAIIVSCWQAAFLHMVMQRPVLLQSCDSDIPYDLRGFYNQPRDKRQHREVTPAS